MQFGILGPLYIRDGDTVIEVPAARPRVLLAALLVHAGTVVSTDALAEAVWDGSPPAGAADTLRSHVMRLRRTLGTVVGARLVTRSPGYLIDATPDDVDVLRFTALCRDTGTAVRDTAWQRALDLADRALGLWRGEPLSDVPSEMLRSAEVRRLHQLRLQELEWRAEAGLQVGRHSELVPQLQALTAEHPLQERFHYQLMLALYRCGRQAEALRAYQAASGALYAELGVAPGVELQQLHQRILSADPGLAELPAEQTIETTARPTDTPSYASADTAVPRQLPAAPGHFIGRQAELTVLTGLVTQPNGIPAGTVVISAIDGMAGIGKTALAIHAAHQLADQFADGQLFLDLHGYTQGYEPRPPGEALETALRALGVSPGQIPPEMEERAALYRQHLVDTRTLILLDNAASEAQVRPLLPGATGCLVLITSRRRLKGLYDAQPLPLDLLPEADAVALLHTVAGPGRTSAGDPVLAQIAKLCGRLPLALRMAGALLRHRPAWTVDHLARLLSERQGLIALSDGERDLSAVFGLSYGGLTGVQQRLFRYLGLIPGPHTDAYAAAALTGSDPGTTGQLLEDLVDQNLLMEPVPARYRLHDLVRRYARALANADPAEQRAAAIDRLMDYYQSTSCRANARIALYARPAPDGPLPAHAPAFEGPEAAWAWLRAERANLLAALQDAITRADHGRIIALTTGLATLLRTDGPWTEAITLLATAAASAQRHEDRLARSRVLIDLGDLRLLTDDYPGATRDLQEALRLCRELGDRHGQAAVLLWLGNLRRMTSDYLGAAADLQGARHMCRELGDRLGESTALMRLGYVRRVIGDYLGAEQAALAALHLYRQLGDRPGQGNALCHLGAVRALTGDFAAAIHDLQDGLDLCRALDDRLRQGNALLQLGKARSMTGDYPAALRDFQEALKLYRSLGVRPNEGGALAACADVTAATGDYERALTLYHNALDIARHTGQLDDEAVALEGIGECHLRTDRTQTGTAYLSQALDLFQRVARSPDADRIQDRLTQLAQPSSTDG